MSNLSKDIPITLINPIPLLKPDVILESLHESMDINKEALERRLLLRRTLPELVDLGIYPTLNAPPGYVEQSRNLERAKARDLLQKKLKLRPDRKCLVQHHILEDTNPLVDRSLQDKQRLLKRSRLQDNLRDHLAHRPGPLELLSKNILLLNSNSSADKNVDSTDGMFQSSVPAGVSKDCSFDFAMPDFSRQTFVCKATAATTEESYSTTIASSGSFSSYDSLADISIAESDLSSPEGPNFLSYSHDSGVCIPPAPDITPLLLSNPSMAIPCCSPPPPPPLPRPISPTRTFKFNKKLKANRVKPIKFHEYKGPKPLKENKTADASKIDPENLRTMVEQERQVLAWRLSDQSRGANDVEMSIEELRSRLDDLKVAQLQEICKQLGVKASGSKPDRIERIVKKLIDGECGDAIVKTTPSFSNSIKRENEGVHMLQGKNGTSNHEPLIDQKMNSLKESFIKIASDLGLSVEELLSRLNLQLTNHHQRQSVGDANLGCYINSFTNQSIEEVKIDRSNDVKINWPALKGENTFVNSGESNKNQNTSQLNLRNFRPAFRHNSIANGTTTNGLLRASNDGFFRAPNFALSNGLVKSRSEVLLESNGRTELIGKMNSEVTRSELQSDYVILPRKYLSDCQNYNSNLSLTPTEILLQQQMKISQLQNDLIKSQQLLMEANRRAMKKEMEDDDKNLYNGLISEFLLDDVLNIINNDAPKNSSCPQSGIYSTASSSLFSTTALDHATAPSVNSNPLSRGTMAIDESSLMDVFDTFSDSAVYQVGNEYSVDNSSYIDKKPEFCFSSFTGDEKGIDVDTQINFMHKIADYSKDNLGQVFDQMGPNGQGILGLQNNGLNCFLDSSVNGSDLYLGNGQTSTQADPMNFQIGNMAGFGASNGDTDFHVDNLFFNSNWCVDNFLGDVSMDFGGPVVPSDNYSLDLDMPAIGTFDL